MTQKYRLDKQKLIDIARQHNIAYLALFGSHARGEAAPESDIDLYVRFGRRTTLFEMLSIKYEMEEATGAPIDLLAEEVVEPYDFVRNGMAQDLVVLYESDKVIDDPAQ